MHNDTLLTGAIGVTEMHTSGTGTTGVKIYFDEADGDRWYLRVYLNSADEEVVVSYGLHAAHGYRVNLQG